MLLLVSDSGCREAHLDRRAAGSPRVNGERKAGQEIYTLLNSHKGRTHLNALTLTFFLLQR